MELCPQMAILHEGKVLYAGSPEDALNAMRGHIWQRFIEKGALPQYESTFKVISHKLVGGKPFIHVFSEEPPGEGFSPAIADLEDVFFAKLRGLN